MSLPPTNGNGQGKILWWVIGLLSTIILGLGSHNLTTTSNNTARISVLESHVMDHKEALVRIERKLDRVLESLVIGH